MGSNLLYSSFWSSNTIAFEGTFLRAIQFNWSMYVIEKVKIEVTPYLGFTISGKLNFNYCALGNFGPLEIGGVIRDHSGFVVRAFSKIVGEGLVIETKILALLEGLLHARALSLSNLYVEEDSTILISRVAKFERRS